MRQVLVDRPQGDGGLAILFHIISVYFCNTHQVPAGLPQGLGGLGILFYIVLV
jgi:hypothetical protein